MIDVSNDREISDVLHLHRICIVAARPRLKKSAGRHLYLICRKARILADFAQIITDFGDFKEVMAKFFVLMQ